MENHIIIKYLKTLGYEIHEVHQSGWIVFQESWDQRNCVEVKFFKIGHKKLLIQNDELYLDLDTNPIAHELIKIDISTEQTTRQAIDK